MEPQTAGVALNPGRFRKKPVLQIPFQILPAAYSPASMGSGQTSRKPNSNAISAQSISAPAAREFSIQKVLFG